jgi:hypothetical protein
MVRAAEVTELLIELTKMTPTVTMTMLANQKEGLTELAHSLLDIRIYSLSLRSCAAFVLAFGFDGLCRLQEAFLVNLIP